MEDPGVVDQDVQSAHPVQDVGEHLLRSGGIGQVRGDGDGILWQLSGLLLQGFLVTAGDGHPSTGAGEAGADHSAEPASAARDERVLPEERPVRRWSQIGGFCVAACVSGHGSPSAVNV